MKNVNKHEMGTDLDILEHILIMDWNARLSPPHNINHTECGKAEYRYCAGPGSGPA